MSWKTRLAVGPYLFLYAARWVGWAQGVTGGFIRTVVHLSDGVGCWGLGWFHQVGGESVGLSMKIDLDDRQVYFPGGWSIGIVCEDVLTFVVFYLVCFVIFSKKEKNKFGQLIDGSF